MFLRIEGFIKPSIDFKSQDYDVLGLKKERIFTKGELTRVNLYADKTGEGYVDLVIKEDIIYNRNEFGYITDRVKTITWIKEDGTDHVDNKITTKYYSNEEAAVAGERKRGNMITTLKIETVGMIAMTQPCTITEAEVLGMTFIIANDTYMNMYKLGARQPLIDAITNDTTNAWLDNDLGGINIRNYMINYLS